MYVDDLLIRGEHISNINHIKRLLSSQFKMKDKKELHYFLGIEVIRTSAGIMISQQHYNLNLLYKFGALLMCFVDEKREGKHGAQVSIVE